MGKRDSENKREPRSKVERRILCIIINNEDSFQILTQQSISGIHFSPGPNRTLFEFAYKYHEKYGELISEIVLEESAQKLNFRDDEVSSLVSIYRAINRDYGDEVSLKDLKFYINELRNYCAKDTMLSLLGKYQEVSEDEGDLKAMGVFQDELSKSKSALESDSSIDVKSAYELIDILAADMENRRINPDKYFGVKTGIGCIDKALHPGLRSGELTLFMAPPGGGKSTIMLSMADAIWRYSKQNVLYVSLEMPVNPSLAYKHLACQTMVPVKDMEDSTMTPEQYKRVEAAWEETEQLENQGVHFLYLDVASAGKVKCSLLESSMRGMVSQYHPKVVFVDYLELLDPGTGTDTWVSYGDVCKFLRGLGRNWDFSVVSAIQLKRAAIDRIRKTKTGEIQFGADDAQGSNQVSADADRIFAALLNKNTLSLFTAKNRYGDRNYDCKLIFDGACSRVFEERVMGESGKIIDDTDFDAILNGNIDLDDDDDDEDFD